MRTMAKAKRVAVIGGGFSGFGAMRSLKRNGIEPVCFEKTPYCGGTWKYHEEDVEGVPSVMWTTIINHSKEMGAVSDFPPAENIPNYMKHSELYNFFLKFGKHYDLFRHVTCNREVISVKRAEDYDTTGRWEVTVRNTENGEISSDIYDGVTLCVGHITYTHIPDFPGMKDFKGKIIHTHSLKKVHMFAERRVVVVGIGCSGLDAAVEISSVANQVYLSTRSGSWIMPRVGRWGLPFDYSLFRRYIVFFQTILPNWLSSRYVEKLHLDPNFDHKLYNLKPKTPFFSKDPAINDGLPSKLLSGTVVLRKNIKEFAEDGVIFEGEDEVTICDTVIMATGYKWKFPFLEDGIIVTENGRINLYKCMYPPHLKHPTLAVIGFLLPFGPGFPIGEMQCRWAALVMKGECSLPSQEVMMRDIIRRHEENAKRYTPSEKMSVRVDYIQYLDEISSQFGAKPNLFKLAFTDPRLFLALLFGPSVPYQYRLQGPHKWEGAREAILTAPQRMKAPLRIKQKEEKLKGKKKWSLTAIVKVIIVLLLIIFWTVSKETSIKYYLPILLIPFFVTIKGVYTKLMLFLMAVTFLII